MYKMYGVNALFQYESLEKRPIAATDKRFNWLKKKNVNCVKYHK
jgi:hypothetical protein